MKEKTISEMIAANMEAEGDAIKQYLPLMDALREAGDAEGLKLIEDITAEEMKHSLILTAMLKKQNANVKVEASGAKEAVEYLLTEM